MAETSIEWTATYHADGSVTKGHSINPIRARNVKTGAVGHYCEKISSGCAHCYASTLQKRFKMPEFGGQRSELPDDIKPFLDESKLQEVLRRKKPTKYFWCDMTDMFGSWVPDEWIDKCFAVMALTPQHTHLVLTKRPERMAEYLLRHNRCNLIDDAKCEIMSEMPDQGRSVDAYVGEEGSGYFEHGYLANVWPGTSIENQQQANDRLPHLLRCPAAVRFVSAEPLLEEITIKSVCTDPPNSGFALTDGWGRPDGEGEPGIHWVIVGGESGHNARPFNLKWARSLRDQCAASGAAFFFKQAGSNAFDTKYSWASNDGRLGLKDRKGGDISEFPEDLRVRQFPQPVLQET